MPLIDSRTTLSDAIIAQVYTENLADLRDLQQQAHAPPVPVRDPLRLEQVASLLDGALELLDHRGAPGTRDERIGAANLTYDLMVVATEAWKNALEISRVPRRRSPSPA